VVGVESKSLLLGVKYKYRTIFSVSVALRVNVAGVQKNAAVGATTAKFPYDVLKIGFKVRGP
jgi:hypothetical protein